MKKILFSLVVIIFTLFTFNQADAQCNGCLVPKVCTTVTLNIPGCGDIDYVICYQCGITALRILNAEIIEIRNIPYGCEDAVWDAGYKWILENVANLCGNFPCDQGSRKVHIERPICANMIYNPLYPGKYTIQYDRTACDKRCIVEYDWCWCNCTPDCWVKNCMPHFNSTKTAQYTEGADECNLIEYSYSDKNAQYYLFSTNSWIINCQKFVTICD